MEIDRVPVFTELSERKSDINQTIIPQNMNYNCDEFRKGGGACRAGERGGTVNAETTCASAGQWNGHTEGSR